MIDETERSQISELEDGLLEKGFSIDTITACYCDLLLSIIDTKKVSTNDSEVLHNMRSRLLWLKSQETIRKNKAQKEELRTAIWKIESAYTHLDRRTSALARCIVYCFVDEESWELGSPGEPTPLFYQYLDLKKLDQSLTADFINHYHSLLYGQKQP